LFGINALLQAMKKPIWTLWISIYRQGFGVAFFVFICVGLLDMDTLGVWLGIGMSVVTGFLLSAFVADRVARQTMGGLQPQS